MSPTETFNKKKSSKIFSPVKYPDKKYSQIENFLFCSRLQTVSLYFTVDINLLYPYNPHID